MKPGTLFRAVSFAAALLALVSTRAAVAQEGCGEGYCWYQPPCECDSVCVPCVEQHFEPGQPPPKFDFGTGHAIKFETNVLQPFNLNLLFVPITNATLSDRLNIGLDPVNCIPYDGATSNTIPPGTCGFYHVDNPPAKGSDYDGPVTVKVWWDFPTLDQLNNVRLYRAPIPEEDPQTCWDGFECYTQDITNAVYAFGDSLSGDPGVKGTGPGFSDFEAVDLTRSDSTAARVWIGLKKSNDSGIRFDLKAVVKKNGSQVSFGELLGAPGGGKGFGNSNLLTIPLSLPAVAFQHGDKISFKLFVRNSCVGSNKNSGSARLWYNDDAANSRVDEPGAPTLYLVRGDDDGEDDREHDEDGGDLSKNAGNGPKKKKNVHVNAPVPSCDGPYKSFGKWSGLVP